VEGRIVTRIEGEFYQSTAIEPFRLLQDGFKWRYEVTGGQDARVDRSRATKG
jgi:hypothetical protein